MSSTETAICACVRLNLISGNSNTDEAPQNPKPHPPPSMFDHHAINTINIAATTTTHPSHKHSIPQPSHPIPSRQSPLPQEPEGKESSTAELS